MDAASFSKPSAGGSNRTTNSLASCSASRFRWIFPVGPVGNSFNETIRLGTLKAGKCRATNFPQLHLAGSLPVLGNDGRRDIFAQGGMHHRKGHSLPDPGVIHQHLVDLVGCDFFRHG